MTPRACFRFDAGPRIGGGHAMRALALADALAANGWACTLATNADAGDTVPALAWSGHELIAVATRDAVPMTQEFDLLVVDHYGLDAAFERACRPRARQILAIDDLADRPHDADIVVDPTPGQTAGRYEAHLAPGARCLAGPGYAPLRPQFQRARGHDRRPAARIERVLVSAGAGDPTGLAGRALAGVRQVLPDARVDIVGRAPAEPSDDARVRRLSGVDDMAALYRAADVCIGAVGVSALERACVGLPTLAVITADNQELVAEGLARAGAIRLLGRDDALGPGDIAAALPALGPQDLSAMADAGRALCDGRGVQRLQLAIAGVDTATPLRLRLAEPDDGDRMLEWQRDPRTRRYARNPQAPTPAEHAGWLSGVLADPDRMLLMVCEATRPVGVLRFDAVRGGAREISIYLDPGLQGRGHGRAALALARRLFPAIAIEAEVLPDNAASRRAFAAAGFAAVSDTRMIAHANRDVAHAH